MTAKEFTIDDVALHNKDGDCWIIINGKVYDVTKFLDKHPGGADIIMDEAGTDATSQFEDTGHSPDARKEMLEYEIGKLKEGEVSASGKRKSKGNAGGVDVNSQGVNPGVIVAGVILVLAVLFVLLNPSS